MMELTSISTARIPTWCSTYNTTPRHHRLNRKAETQFGLSIAWEKAAIASADSLHAMLPTAACETWRTMSGLDNCKHSRPKSRVR